MPSLNRFEPRRLVLIGASTGGPGHIRKIIESLQTEYRAAIIIAQHMADEFMPSFVNQLKKISPLEVSMAEHDTVINAGRIHICRSTTMLRGSSGKIICRQSSDMSARYNPDIDCLFDSAASLAAGCDILGIILTGVGDDGAKGCQSLSQAGARCIAESEATAIVYGMPLQVKLKVDGVEVQGLEKITESIRFFGA